MGKNEFHFCHILFKGEVQGVGFRYSASRTARSLSLRGYVRNLSDGSVEVQLEGNRETIEQFIESIKESMRGHIFDTELEWDKGKNRFADFKINF
jgi:acylphosphatase